jgi:ribosomal protein S18 acetylase RimI-like enzyme
MIEIAKLTNSDIESVKQINLPETQALFAASSKDFLLDCSETMHLHIIKFNNEIVGFFKLDIAYALTYPFCPSDGIGLRTFVIDKDQQGQGIGTNAVKALFFYLKMHYSDYHSIYLTVNCKNIGAYHCYQKGGFECLKEKYLGGMLGPQYVMRKNL